MKKTYEINTEDITEPEEQIAFLLMENEVIVNNGWWDKSWPKDAITHAVNCNDVFAWGCADAENFSFSDISVIFELYLLDPGYGIAAWCIHKRKDLPQDPVRDAMVLAGWDVDALLKVGYAKDAFKGARSPMKV